MGDTGEGLDELALALARRPSACARSVRIDGGGGDRYSSYVGDVAAQVSAVCEAVVGDETRRASGTTRTHALGFSQGGQFARALVETCDGVKFTTLVTFGAQHLGVDALPGCGGDWATISRACRALNAMASALSASDFRAATHRAGAVLSGYVHEREIPALFGDERVLAVGEQRGDRERERRSVSARGVDVVGAIRNVHVRIR